MSSSYDAVVMVASAGGIHATAEVLCALPADFPIPIFLVQHRPDGHGRLVDVLERSTRLTVKQAEENEVPRPGTVYLSPAQRHLTIAPSQHVELLDGVTRIHYLLSSGDPLFTSAAKAFGKRTIAVVLSGRGADGARGVTDVKAAGGYVIAQDKATSQFFDMPKAAIATGCVDAILPPAKIGEELIELVGNGKSENPGSINGPSISSK